MTEEKRNEYLKRLAHEYEDFKRDMYSRSSGDVFDRAQDIVNMKYAYDYLRSADISDNELDYVMKAKNPISEVAGTRQAFDEVNYFENPMALTVHDIYDKELFDDGDTELFTDRIPICFHRKVTGVAEIESFSRLRQDDVFKIEKVIRLQPEEFEIYANDLQSDQPFIIANADLMRMDKNKIWHCLLVKDTASERGILVESDGYDYARYAAYVQNTRELDLRDVPTEELSKPKGRQRKLAKQHKAPER
jgi:hypothetical protein